MEPTQQMKYPERTVPVERLRKGDHACMAFGDQDESWQVLTAYTRASLARDEKVLVVSDLECLGADGMISRLDGGSGQVAAARDRGQLSVRSNSDVYVPDGAFSQERTVDTYTKEIDLAYEQGWSGMQIAADMSWAPRAGVEHSRVVDYEAAVAPLFESRRFTSICWYDRQHFDDSQVREVDGVHPLKVMERMDALDVSTSPQGERIAGSAWLDTRVEFIDALQQALDQQDAAGPRRLQLDLTDLCYMEAHCAARLISVAGSLPAGSEITVRCGPLLGVVLRQLGADEVPQLALNVVEEQ